MESDCHSKKDTIDKINFTKMEKVSKLGFLVTWNLANLQEELEIDNNVWLKESESKISKKYK